MHKKILCIILAFFLVITAAPFETSAATADNSDTHLVTSYCLDNYLDLRIQGDKLIISGVLSTGFDSPFWATFGINAINDYFDNMINITPGKKFSVEILLKYLTEPSYFQVYTGKEEYGTYHGYIWHNIYLEPDGAGGYRFCASPILENNLKKESYWINPAAYLGKGISEEIQALSDEIVKGAKNDYEKVFLLYKWVVDNIYYDYDVYYSQYNDTPERTSSGSIDLDFLEQYLGISSNITADSVLNTRRTVCEGYSNILQALIQAQSIPCIKVNSYALGLSTTGEWDDRYISAEDSNHAHNEAFVDGRWIVMDATWDSNNKYENGEYIAKDANCFLYFDITPEVFAGNHNIISRPKASEADTPSLWAQEEVLSAVSEGFVPGELQGDYRKSITREEFCRLIMEMLCKNSRMSFNEYLKSKKIILNSKAFTDTTNEYILAANALGIVNGNGNGLFAPNANITRQEAATMLTRTAKFLGITSTNCEAISFADSDKFSSWAADSIAFITSLAGRSGTRIMGKTGRDTFSPQDTYTREQSIMTVFRLYECL